MLDNPTQDQVRKLADISADIAQVCLASLVIPFFVNQSQIGLGIITLAVAVIFWLLSLYFVKLKV